ncbi:bifunctional 2',3'-cyclic-nucleotide 2'-phosphodiesterase/3'-nucleotidase [Yoonia sediminilitoris]|uniref:bifunctional 2',3'-cyclic-nucleotide 2'-phosphodiesterase/3'-nucleotidase n=1 Tax=Yoonia sediminilitoris TaxID=1286148 RepID=UPI0015F02B14|nr:bifunctional 2',3'-cyclic-nucleotide 2'-phosphodiesterase/3'-nucleotidase [Yoonia sediminilitoris]
MSELVLSGQSARVDGCPTARLRLLETTDLHMQLLAYDYFSDAPDYRSGLVQLAETISAYKNDPAMPCLLFDNGDFIQGNPLADFLVESESTMTTHPMIAALNTLQYDAVTLGNHEFNYGLQFLQNALKNAEFPVVCANVAELTPPRIATDFSIIARELACDDGQTRTIRIGVTGFVTPQITDWDNANLAGQIETTDIVDAARAVVPRIKAAGADIIVALCHSGIGAADHTPRMENAAVPLAEVAGIDVVMTGHTHELFPGNNEHRSTAVDAKAGTLHGKPAVMAGFFGKWLGVIDLMLGWDQNTWHIKDHQCYLRPCNGSDKTSGPLQEKLSGLVESAHAATVAHIRRPIAQTSEAIHSYFANIGPDGAQRLLSDAQRAFVTTALERTAHAGTPVLSATAPYRFGGRAGPGHFIHIPPGPLTLRDAAAIYPFANKLCAVKRNGAQIQEWLERAASYYSQIVPGRHDQALLDCDRAGYNSDTLVGLTYEIDLSSPAAYTADGARTGSDTKRIRNLCYGGMPVKADDCFIVATNSYRTNGGGGFEGAPKADIVFETSQSTRDILIEYLQRSDTIRIRESHTWSFAHLPNTSAVFNSAPAAKHHLVDGISHIGPGTDGFDLFRITF